MLLETGCISGWSIKVPKFANEKIVEKITECPDFSGKYLFEENACSRVPGKSYRSPIDFVDESSVNISQTGCENLRISGEKYFLEDNELEAIELQLDNSKNNAQSFIKKGEVFYLKEDRQVGCGALGCGVESLDYWVHLKDLNNGDIELTSGRREMGAWFFIIPYYGAMESHCVLKKIKR